MHCLRTVVACRGLANQLRVWQVAKISDVLSTGVLEQHLLPHLTLPDLQCLGQLSMAFKRLVKVAPDRAWIAAANKPPSCAYLTSTGCSLSGKAVRRNAEAQAAVRSGAGAVEYELRLPLLSVASNDQPA